MLARSVLFIALAALIASAAPSGAGAVVLGPGSGLTAAATTTTITVTLTPAAVAAARLRKGAALEADCQAVPRPGGLAFGPDGQVPANDAVDDEITVDGELRPDGTATLTVDEDATGRHVLTGYDACQLDAFTAPRNGSYSSYAIGEIGLTEAGRAYADESERAPALRRALVAAAQPAGGYAAATAVPGVTALAAPTDSVPAGQIGYWTDGHQALTTTTSTAGRRLVLADRGDFTLASNVLDQSDPFGISDLADPDVLGALLGGKAGGTNRRVTPKRDPERDGSRPKHLRSRDGVTPLPGLRAALAGDHRLVLRFTGTAAASYRAIAGRKIRATCLPVAPRSLFPMIFRLFSQRSYAAQTGVARVPRRGGRVTVTLQGRAAPDFCVVDDDGVTVATFAATPAGRTRLQDIDAIRQLEAGTRKLALASKGATAYRPAAAVIAADPQHLVALPGPEATPPLGRIGVWTDGAQHATIAVRSAGGARFAFSDEGDGVVASNVLSLYTADGLAFLATLEIS